MSSTYEVWPQGPETHIPPTASPVGAERTQGGPERSASTLVARPGAMPAQPLLYIDVLRVLATLAVVVIHVSDRIVTTLDPAGPAGWWAGTFAEAGTRWAVPVFLMISGVLLLSPSRTEPAGVFLRRRAQRIGPPLLFWSVAYLGLRALMINRWHMAGMPEHFNLHDLANLLAYGAPFDHLWYLCMLPGLYLLIPPLRSLVRRASLNRCLLVGLAILGVGCIYRSTLAYFTDGREIAWFSGILLSGYLLLGYWLNAVSWRNASPWRWLTVLVLSTVAAAVGTKMLLLDSGNDESRFVLFNPISPTVIVMAVSVFVLVRRVPWTPASRVAALCRHVAPATFGIYLVHPMVMSVLRRACGLGGSTIHPLFGIVVASAAVFVLSYAIVACMMRIPYLRRVVA